MSQIHRRRFVLTAGALLAAPLFGYAQQQSKVWTIGLLSNRSAPTPAMPDLVVDGFVQGMRELGYVEGRNLIVERHFTGGDFKLLSEIVVELARKKVDVIVLGSGGTRAAKAARQATTTLPIVSSAIGDPVLAGLADSLARPGKNVTGLTNIAGELELKRFELLREILPGLGRVAYVSNPEIQGSLVDLKKMQAALKRIGVDAVLIDARNREEIGDAFIEMVRQKVHAAVFATEATFLPLIGKLGELTLKNKLPAAIGFPEATGAGFLVSYGPGLSESGRQVAVYVDKILKGAKASDLPMERPTRFELGLNLKTAKVLGLTIPQSILVRADRVIE